MLSGKIPTLAQLHQRLLHYQSQIKESFQQFTNGLASTNYRQLQQEKTISALITRTQELQRQIAVERANRVELAEIVARQQEQIGQQKDWRNRLHNCEN